jgi:hypothetical protein
MLSTKEIFLIAALLCFVMFLVLFSVKENRVHGVSQLLLASVLGMAGNVLYALALYGAGVIAMGAKVSLKITMKAANFQSVLTAHAVAMQSRSPCRPIHASSFTNAKTAKPSCGRNRATAASIVLTAR